MELSKYSEKKLRDTMIHFHMERDFSDPMYNYLVHGFEPGSCFTSVLANDFFNAMFRSHPANTVTGFKDLCKWIINIVPPEAYGSYDDVKNWCKMSSADRRKILEEHGLIFTTEEEVWMTLKEPA